MKYIGKISVYIGLLAMFFDMIAHQFLSPTIYMIHRMDNFLDPSSLMYFFGKAAIVAIVSFAVLSYFNKRSIWRNLIHESVIIGVLSAIVFGSILYYLQPYSYDPIMHVVHAVLIIPAAYIVLKHVKK